MKESKIRQVILPPRCVCPPPLYEQTDDGWIDKVQRSVIYPSERTDLKLNAVPGESSPHDIAHF